MERGEAPHYVLGVGHKSGLFRANRGPRPSVDGLVSVDGLAFLTKTKTFWVIKHPNTHPTNK